MLETRCRFCSSTFTDELIRKIKNDIDDVYCENCGDLIKNVQNKNIIRPTDISYDEPKNVANFASGKPYKDSNPHPDAFKYPIGRIFYDTDFPLIFKSNFGIVFSRLYVQVC